MHRTAGDLFKMQNFIIVLVFISVLAIPQSSLKKPPTKLNLQDNPPRWPRFRYTLYKRSNRDGYLINGNTLPSEFDRSQETLVLIHGLLGSSSGECIQRGKNVLLDREDYNILVLDYSSVSQGYIAVYQYVAKQLGTFLLRNNVPESKTTFIGGSLGAQVAGMVRRQSSFKVREIIGLDPAGPAFDRLPESKRLNPRSADYVMAIHTNAGRFGSSILLGHDDIFVNGGNNYPCCPTDVCSHRGSCDFLIRIVEQGPLQGRLCSNLEQAKRNSCLGNETMVSFPTTGVSSRRRIIHVPLSTCSRWTPMSFTSA